MAKINSTPRGRVVHICVSKLTIIGSDNGLSPGRRQAIIWTNAAILWIRTIGTTSVKSLSNFISLLCPKTIRHSNTIVTTTYCLKIIPSHQTTSWNRNVFRVTGPLCGEFTGHRWIPRTKASDAELCCYCLNTRLSKQSWGWWFETPSNPSWHQSNGARTSVWV